MSLETDLIGPTDWETVQGWSWEQIQDICTDFGAVRSLRMQSGHHLVLKVEETAMTEGRCGAPVALPRIHTRKSVGNLNLIRGIVLRTSEPFVAHRRQPLQRWIYDGQQQRMVVKTRYRNVPTARIASPLREGDAILYNSYNVGNVRAAGLSMPLVVVRLVDVLAVFPAADVERVAVDDRTMGMAAA